MIDIICRLFAKSKGNSSHYKLVHQNMITHRFKCDGEVYPTEGLGFFQSVVVVICQYAGL